VTWRHGKAFGGPERALCAILVSSSNSTRRVTWPVTACDPGATLALCDRHTRFECSANSPPLSLYRPRCNAVRCPLWASSACSAAQVARRTDRSSRGRRRGPRLPPQPPRRPIDTPSSLCGLETHGKKPAPNQPNDFFLAAAPPASNARLENGVLIYPSLLLPTKPLDPTDLGVLHPRKPDRGSSTVPSKPHTPRVDTGASRTQVLRHCMRP
jgi:hypothetical protein